MWIPIIHLFPYNGGLSYKMADNVKGIFHQPQREERDAEKEGKKSGNGNLNWPLPLMGLQVFCGQVRTVPSGEEQPLAEARHWAGRKDTPPSPVLIGRLGSNAIV